MFNDFDNKIELIDLPKDSVSVMTFPKDISDALDFFEIIYSKSKGYFLSHIGEEYVGPFANESEVLFLLCNILMDKHQEDFKFYCKISDLIDAR